jgi:hypothetical protein
VEVGEVDGTRLDRLIQQPSADRYTVLDRYLNLSEEMRIDDVRYTITLYGAQYLGPDGFDRAGIRVTASPAARAAAVWMSRRSSAVEMRWLMSYSPTRQ